MAGITERDHQHIRPVIGERLPTTLLRPDGGPFDMGAIVELGTARPVGRSPEIEDHLVWPDDIERNGYVGTDRLWNLLEETASDSLAGIFGADLELSGVRDARASVAVGAGRASLGCYRPGGPVSLRWHERDGAASLRLVLEHEGLDLSLTDARYYTDRYRQPASSRWQKARSEIESGVTVLLGIGLTRPFSPFEHGEERHWLQVNALHLESCPGLRLA